MTPKCRIIKLAHVDKGVAAILEFSNRYTPHLGTTMSKGDKPEVWRIAGIGMPTLLSVSATSIVSVYDSEAVWECLLSPSNLNSALSEGDELDVI